MYSIWSINAQALRLVLANYEFNVCVGLILFKCIRLTLPLSFHCATSSDSRYLTISTEDRLLVTWPLLDSGLVVHQREVTTIPVGPEGGASDTVSPVVIMDSKQVVSSSPSGHLHFVSAATMSHSGRQLFGN